jgi:acyl transferase domain-containing protein
VSEFSREPIAIVGIGCRLPGGVSGPESLWDALCSGLDAIGPIPRDRFDADALFSAGAPAPGRIGTRFGGFLEAIDRFDAAFFGIAPREAETLDPQQRLLLETAWEALEDAGTPPSSLAGSRAGVFVGLWLNDFEGRLFADPAVDFHATTGTGRYAASGRISFALGLQGPSLTVDTACSSSLVAIHLACRSLWSRECPVALAGGANVILQPHITIAYSQSGMMAPDGRCKFGDARADGYVRSEGAGMVVLKPLANALADGDRVYAVIRGSAVNNDGRSGPYMATPSQAGQEQMLRLACEDAGIPPAEIDYVEAHGTGTGAGDPVEIGALGAVLGAGRAAGEKAALGSIKTNFGHTEGAAGVSGLIKSALVLHHGEIPASLHLREPNPAIPWSDLPVFVASEGVALPERDRPRRAGVSSFGIAGTNAHVVLEEHAGAPRPAVAGDSAEAMLLPISARSEAAARELAERWADRLERGLALRDAVHTAALRRDHHPARISVVGTDPYGVARALRERAAPRPVPSIAPGSAPRCVFVFPGQGSQWPGMGTELLRDEPIFREAIGACERAMPPWVDWSLREQLALRPDDPRYALDRIDVVQPVLVSLDIALAALWRSWGIEPDAVVGHSMGEVAAAAVAGALGLDDAMRVICVRSRLLRRISGRGAMAVVELDHAAAESVIAAENGAVSVAAINGPRTTILAGDPSAVDRVLARLEADGVFGRRVAVDVASHSAQVEPLADELRDALRELRPREASIPFHSTVERPGCSRAALGCRLLGPQPPSAGAAARGRHAARSRRTRRVRRGQPAPGAAPAIQQSLGTDGGLTVGSLRRDEPERASMLAALGTIWEAGASVRWDRVNPEGRHAAAPTYPWQKERYWSEPRRKRRRRRRCRAPDPLGGGEVGQRRGDPERHARPRGGADGWRTTGCGAGSSSPPQRSWRWRSQGGRGRRGRRDGDRGRPIRRDGIARRGGHGPRSHHRSADGEPRPVEPPPAERGRLASRGTRDDHPFGHRGTGRTRPGRAEPT